MSTRIGIWYTTEGAHRLEARFHITCTRDLNAEAEAVAVTRNAVTGSSKDGRIEGFIFAGIFRLRREAKKAKNKFKIVSYQGNNGKTNQTATLWHMNPSREFSSE